MGGNFPHRTSAGIRVIATFAVRPEHVDDFVAVARATLVEPAGREAGCLQYDLCQDVTDPARFAMIEAWESRGFGLLMTRDAATKDTACWEFTTTGFSSPPASC